MTEEKRVWWEGFFASAFIVSLLFLTLSIVDRNLRDTIQNSVKHEQRNKTESPKARVDSQNIP